jgi:glycosyltransferase involved in cell wall biosynthesis
VVYDTGGSREGLRHGETGFLVKPGDLRSAVEYLRRLVTDPELRERMGRAGRAFVRERFDPSRFAERHERLYLQVIDGFRKSRVVFAAAALSAALAEGRALQLFG